MPIDPGLIGSVINALPLDRMIAGPIMAAMKAQVQASKSFMDFLMTVCIDKGKARMVQFDYDETIVDTEGNVTGVQRKTIRIPLMAAISLPNFAIEKTTIDFELTVSQSSEEHSSTEAKGGFTAKIGWGPFSVSMHGSVSHKSEQTRKTDTRAKYSIHVEAGKQDPPEALMRVMNFLTDAATKPSVLPANKELAKPETLTGDVPSPDEEQPANAA